MIWDASDANPMHRRLPAEVISRRQPRKQPKQTEDTAPAEVTVDLKVAITLKPEARAKWLSKACAMVEQGKASSNDLYDIITNRKFSGGLPERVGRKLAASLRDSMSVFSDKQQRSLTSSESPFGALMSAREDPDEEKVDTAREAEPSTRTGATSGVAMLKITPSRSAASRQEESKADRQEEPKAGRQEGASNWQVAEDDATVRRMQALDAAEAAKKAKEETGASRTEAKKKAGDEEEAKRKKIGGRGRQSLWLSGSSSRCPSDLFEGRQKSIGIQICRLKVHLFANCTQAGQGAEEEKERPRELERIEWWGNVRITCASPEPKLHRGLATSSPKCCIVPECRG